jgi:hypothetical protein
LPFKCNLHRYIEATTRALADAHAELDRSSSHASISAEILAKNRQSERRAANELSEVGLYKFNRVDPIA